MQEQYSRLKELDQLKGNFVNAVTHELRTPLTSIMGYAEFLEDESGGSLAPRQREFVQNIQRGAKRMENLLKDLLDFAQIDAGTFRLKLEETDFKKVANEILDSLRPLAAESGIKLEFSLPQESCSFRLDPMRIGQVLTNLLNNAIKFTPPGGNVCLRAGVEGDHLLCEIQDTGEGMRSEDIPLLFQRFMQLDAGVRKGKGTGLGLHISKVLVEAHGGTIGIRSELGKGTTSWFTLPCIQAQ